MALNPNIPGDNPESPRLPSFRRANPADSDLPAPNPPSSKPLQVFFLIALLITGSAYVVDQYTDWQTQDTRAMAGKSADRHKATSRTEFLRETDGGRKAEAHGNLAEAVLHYRRALLAQDIPEGHVILGNALLKQGSPDMAFSQFKEATRLNPNLAETVIAWGRALVMHGRLDEAEQIYQDALRRDPRLAAVHYNYAKLLEEKQQAALAAQHSAESTGEGQVAAHSAAEAQLFGSDAVKHYEAAERLGLSSPDFMGSYGTLLNKQGKYAQAETRLARAVIDQPSLGPAQYQLGLAEDRLGNYGDAIGHYEAALTAMPDDPQTLNNLAAIYATATNAEVRSSKMAVLLGTRACDATSEQNARYLDTLARAYAADGDFFQAVTWEDKAVRRAAQLGDHDLLRELQPRYNLFVQHRLE